MLCVSRMMALCALVVSIGMVGCSGNRIEIMKVEPPTLTLNTMDSVSPFTVTAYNAKNEVVPVTTIAWSSSDVAVLLVDQTGKLTPVKSGVATVTAAAGTAKADVPVTVALFTSLAVMDSAVALTVGEGKTLIAGILDETGAAVQGPLMWESQDRAIVEVTPEGLVTAMAPGQTTVSVRTKGVEAVMLPVTVVAPAPAPKGRAGR